MKVFLLSIFIMVSTSAFGGTIVCLNGTGDLLGTTANVVTEHPDYVFYQKTTVFKDDEVLGSIEELFDDVLGHVVYQSTWMGANAFGISQFDDSGNLKVEFNTPETIVYGEFSDCQ